MRKNRVDAQVRHAHGKATADMRALNLTGAHCLQFSGVDANMLGNVGCTVVPSDGKIQSILFKRSKLVPKEEWVAQCE